MKKFLLILALAACVFGLTACGSEEKWPENFPYSEAQIEEIVSTVFGALDESAAYGTVEEDVQQLEAMKAGTGDMLLECMSIWQGAAEEIGSYKGVVPGSITCKGTEEAFTVSCVIQGSERNADVDLYYIDEYLNVTILPTTMMISPQYTLGEQMEKAALNTLLGMGTVFCVLIIIMLVIMALGIIPKLEAASKAQKAGGQISEKAVDNTIAQIIENEELSDDTELVAVIAAAIAASQGAASTDGFVVRSIRRANTNKWQRA
ncbi:MAG: OadG family protein [Lachnospiraceae bacterium]|nr:OadG family protein [Lachnospiraceae bacterium]